MPRTPGCDQARRRPCGFSDAGQPAKVPHHPLHASLVVGSRPVVDRSKLGDNIEQLTLRGNDWPDDRGEDDVLSGAEGSDTFVFGNSHDDRVTDFAIGVDQLGASVWLDTGDFDANMAHIGDEAADAVIRFGGHGVALVGVERADLSIADFVPADGKPSPGCGTPRPRWGSACGNTDCLGKPP